MSVYKYKDIYKQLKFLLNVNSWSSRDGQNCEISDDLTWLIHQRIAKSAIYQTVNNELEDSCIKTRLESSSGFKYLTNLSNEIMSHKPGMTLQHLREPSFEYSK